MDFLKKGQEMLNKNSGSSSNNQQPAQGGDVNAAQQGGAAQNTSNAGQEDYGDKALNFLEKKTGHTMGRDTNEKITDGAREFYEKQTGKKVDPKYSN